MIKLAKSKKRIPHLGVGARLQACKSAKQHLALLREFAGQPIAATPEPTPAKSATPGRRKPAFSKSALSKPAPSKPALAKPAPAKPISAKQRSAGALNASELRRHLPTASLNHGWKGQVHRLCRHAGCGPREFELSPRRFFAGCLKFCGFPEGGRCAQGVGSAQQRQDGLGDLAGFGLRVHTSWHEYTPGARAHCRPAPSRVDG